MSYTQELVYIDELLNSSETVELLRDPPYPLILSVEELTKAPEMKRASKRTPYTIPRSPNPFFIFRKNQAAKMKLEKEKSHTSETSKKVAEIWRKQDVRVKKLFEALSLLAKKNHMLKYPDYKFQPKKKTDLTFFHVQPRYLDEVDVRDGISFGSVRSDVSPSNTLESYPASTTPVSRVLSQSQVLGRSHFSLPSLTSDSISLSPHIQPNHEMLYLTEPPNMQSSLGCTYINPELSLSSTIFLNSIASYLPSSSNSHSSSPLPTFPSNEVSSLSFIDYFVDEEPSLF
ncbi:1176_t:CDS:1 [Acaulospora morrowiae]|uniref:1176_t:CDS:1 n=1 Tax=Acaulospora morrowiae TaxID=94023 RepID=A0A9N9C7C9_9GLOM|nr:1176_t:CDS:1 [Acaulospora morrowiae]